MEERTEPRAGRASSGTVLNVLLLCGVLSSLVYVATDVLGSMRWAAYDYTSKSVSQLLAVGTPVRFMVVPLMSAYNALVLAFGVGVLGAAGRKRSLRVTGVLLMVYAVFSQMGLMLFPLRLGETEASSGATMHIVDTFVLVVLMFLFIGFGAAALGRRFRIYSIATVLAVFLGGVIAGAQQPRLAANLPTPWLGVIERVNIYSSLLWVAVFAVALILVRRRADRALATRSAAAPAKKVTVFVGSPHKGGATFAAARTFLEHLEAFGDVEGEIVALGDYDLGMCRGCKVCFDRGEEHCPLKDDRDVLIGKIAASDGVVFASPNYSWQVSGLMKVFLDRLGFLFHRPRFHGRTFSAIVVQGIGMGGRIRKYLEFVGGGLGFKVVKGSVSRTLLPMTEEAQRRMDRALGEQSRRFHEELLRPAYPVPSMLQLIMFRMGRTGFRTSAPKDKRDYAYYREQGWFDADYYYATRLGPFKRAVGAFSDWLAPRIPTFKVAGEHARAGEQQPAGPATTRT